MSPVRLVLRALASTLLCPMLVAHAYAQPKLGADPVESGAVARGPRDNRAPVADAGRDRTVTVGSLVQLDGSRSADVDGDRLAFHWTLTRRPAASQAQLGRRTSLAPTFVADVPGTYVVRLVVSDGVAVSEQDAVIVDTTNSAPVADAGAHQTAQVGVPLTLSAAASTDVDGDPLSYAWTVQSAPAGSRAALVNGGDLAPTVVPDLPGRYVARLVVHDGRARSTPATVTIDTTNTAPVSRAAVAADVAVGTPVRLDGSHSTDVDGDLLSYRWALTTRPGGSTATLSDGTNVTTTFEPDQPGTYVAQLLVSDGRADSPPATVVISTTNRPPEAGVRPGQSVAIRHLAVLDGSLSADPDDDPLSYRWSLLSRPAGSRAALSDAHTALAGLVVDRPGTYVAQLIVNDGVADSTPIVTTVHHPHALPVAVPAVGSIVGRDVTLDGSGSFDPDSDPLTYAWSILSKPATSTATLSSPTAVNPTFVMDQTGQYVVQLIVNDGSGDSAPATTIASLFATNPVANAGPDQVLPGVGAVAQLAGSATSMVTTFTWSFVSRPVAAPPRSRTRRFPHRRSRRTWLATTCCSSSSATACSSARRTRW